MGSAPSTFHFWISFLGNFQLPLASPSLLVLLCRSIHHHLVAIEPWTLCGIAKHISLFIESVATILHVWLCMASSSLAICPLSELAVGIRLGFPVGSSSNGLERHGKNPAISLKSVLARSFRSSTGSQSYSLIVEVCDHVLRRPLVLEGKLGCDTWTVPNDPATEHRS